MHTCCGVLWRQALLINEWHERATLSIVDEGQRACRIGTYDAAPMRDNDDQYTINTVNTMILFIYQKQIKPHIKEKIMKCFCQSLKEITCRMLFFSSPYSTFGGLCLGAMSKTDCIKQIPSVSFESGLGEGFEKSRRLFYPLWHLHPDPIWLWGNPVRRGDLSWVAAWEIYLFWIW